MSVVVTGLGQVRPEGSAGDGEWFDPVEHLGPRGWKYLTPATRYLLAAAGLALADAACDPAQLPPESMGVAVGTNFASRPVVGRLDEIVVAEGAGRISPAETPNFSVNIPASHISMKYAMRAFNLSLTNPVVAGLESLLTLASAIRRGRARLGIGGACEERYAASATSEGACCFTLEARDHAAGRGRRPLAEVAGGFSRFLPPGADVEVLGAPLQSLLASADGPLPYAGPDADDAIGRRVDEFCRSGAGVKLDRRPSPGDEGSHATVSPLLQLADLVAECGRGLVVATSPHGHVAALYLR